MLNFSGGSKYKFYNKQLMYLLLPSKFKIYNMSV